MNNYNLSFWRKKFISLLFSNSLIFFLEKFSIYLLIPIIINKIDLEGFGEYSFYVSLSNLIGLFITLGLSKKVIFLYNKNNTNVFSNYFFLKSFLFLLVTPIYFIILYFLNSKNSLDLFYSTIFYLLAFVFRSEWFLHANFNLKPIVYLRFTFKALLLLLVFLHESLTVYSVLLFFSLSELIPSSIIFFLKIKFLNLKVNIVELRKLFNKGLQFIGINIFTSSNDDSLTLFNGLIFGNEILGVYNVAYKISGIARSSVTPIIESFFPIGFKLNKGHYFTIKKISTLIFSIISLLIFIYSDFLYELFVDNKTHISMGSDLIKIVSTSIIFMVINTIYKYEFLTLKRDSEIFRSTSISFLFTLLLIGITLFLKEEYKLYFYSSILTLTNIFLLGLYFFGKKPLYD